MGPAGLVSAVVSESDLICGLPELMSVVEGPA